MAKKETVKKTTPKTKKAEVQANKEVKEVVDITTEVIEEKEVEIVETPIVEEEPKVEEVLIQEEEVKEEVIGKVEPSKEENKSQPTIKRIFGYIWNGQIFG